MLESRMIDTLERASSGPGGCLDGGGTVPPAVPQPPGLSPLHPEAITPKRQAVVDRLRRRIESYRKHQNDCMPRFCQCFNGLCEQNLQDTLQLKQRYLDAKNKRAPKSKDKKQQDSIQSSVHVQQKFLKRPAEDHEGGGPNDGFEPPVKLQCTAQHGAHQPEGLTTKFSVEIVQQLEFTTSAANSQPQQISTNVTVKAHTNASVKSDVSSPKSDPSTPASGMKQGGVDAGGLAECVKQEPDNDFADLDQCAAALEKDAAANGGAAFGGFTDLIGEDTNDEIITSDAFKDLISDISSYPEFMKDFDFDEKSDNNGAVNGMKVEDLKDLPQPVLDSGKAAQSPLLQNQNNYSPPVFENQTLSKSRGPYSNMDFSKTELSPAAQTLKQMAEQHQHKNQMGLTFNPNARVPTSRSPYPDFQFQNDYGSPNSNAPFHKNSPNFPQADVIKQEMIFQGSEFDMKRKGMYNKQQYSPYGSPNPNAGGHGSPGYLPRGNAGGNSAGGAFTGGTPPRPPSGPGGNNSGATLQINQAQQLHISQQSHGHAIQVSAGQNLHLSGDFKGNVSIATQQGMHFTQQHSNMNPSAQQQSSQPNPHQQNPLSGNQQPQSGMPQPSGPQPHPAQPAMGQSHGQMPGVVNAQQHQSAGLHQGPLGGMQGPGGGMGMGNNGPVSCAPAGMHHNGMGGSVPGQGQLGDSYSISQSQTINFTQQTLRQRAAGAGGMPTNMGANIPMGPGGPMPGNAGMGPRPLTPNTMEQQQKLLQQQQILRAQAAMQQHMIRPPPPEYKASAGMMQGMQSRFASGPPPAIRRMPHQNIPPSGPMIRPHNMYIMQQPQQQHMNTRAMYSRQQTPIGSLDSMGQHGNPEWRHLVMTQQQNANFNSQLRPNFQHQGFNMNPGGMQLSALQHQQLRSQQSMVNSGMGVGQQNISQSMSQAQVMNQGGPLTQMNSMNQQMMTHMQQQQQQSMMQQNSPQMSMTNVHMQQSQSLSVSQSLHQQQPSMNSHLVGNQPNPGNPQNNSMGAFNAQTSDFSLEFLENLQSTDTSFTDQELLNSFDTDSGFNLDF